MEQKDKLYIGVYHDYYGALLTEHQREVVADYYDRDLSLAEIAEARGISPQGVRDTLKRAEKQLEEFEQKLGLVARSRKLSALIADAAAKSEDDAQRAILDAAQKLL